MIRMLNPMRMQFYLILNGPLLKKAADTAPVEARWIITKAAETPLEILKELAQDKSQ